jgi:cytochrome c-type biogenesis protein CcmH/NrfF
MELNSLPKVRMTHIEQANCADQQLKDLQSVMRSIRIKKCENNGINHSQSFP